MCSVKKVLLEISQNLQKSTCARVSFLLWNIDGDLYLAQPAFTCSCIQPVHVYDPIDILVIFLFIAL